MKKTTITFLTAGLLLITGLKAQTIQEGLNHLYAKRHKSAADVFQKLIATNPNNIEAIYWLGQSYFNMDDNAAARQLYEKTLTTNGSAPLILVGIGHADLLDNKNNDAKQRFESALTASRGKKGDDPIVETAIGRAIVDSKTGDYKYAIQLLQDATSKDPKNTETLLQLGNAFRKADPGKGGSDAYTYYNKAMDVNPAFAVASLRLAKLFETQQNWPLVLQYLNQAVTKDSRFTDAYYELFWYYFLRRDFTEASNQLKKFIDSKLPETDIMDEYLNGQLCYVSKDYDCAISKANKVLSELGAKTKPRVYKLLAYSYFEKGDYPNALKNVNDYFAKEKKEDIILGDVKLKADILSKTGGSPDEIYNTYIQGVALDSVLTSKIDFLKQGATFFKENKQWDKLAMITQGIIDLKPKPTINDYFELMQSFYKQDNNTKSRDVAVIMRDKFADQVFGYDWAFKNAAIIDTVKRDSIAIPDALRLYDFAKNDSIKFKSQYLNSVRFLGGVYFNKRDKENSLLFLPKWQSADTANALLIQGYIDAIKKMSATPGTKPPGTNPRGTPPPKTGNSKPSATKPKTTTKAIVKK
jgi:tetratricopeptide (TPR) repeat protein